VLERGAAELAPLARRAIGECDGQVLEGDAAPAGEEGIQDVADAAAEPQR
jgi:hypothetical protein